MIRFESKGSFEKTERFFKRMSRGAIFSELRSQGEIGVKALAAYTPKDSGITAASWSCDVIRSRGAYTIEWRNSHTNKGTNIAIILQYGHGTGTGGYVQGRDYINPAIKPVFDQIANDVWKAVTSA